MHASYYRSLTLCLIKKTNQLHLDPLISSDIFQLEPISPFFLNSQSIFYLLPQVSWNSLTEE